MHPCFAPACDSALTALCSTALFSHTPRITVDISVLWWFRLQVTDALNRRRNRMGGRLRHTACAYVNGLLVPRGGLIRVDQDALLLLGVSYVLEVDSVADSAGGAHFEPLSLVDKINDMIQLVKQDARTSS